MIFRDPDAPLWHHIRLRRDGYGFPDKRLLRLEMVSASGSRMALVNNSRDTGPVDSAAATPPRKERIDDDWIDLNADRKLIRLLKWIPQLGILGVVLIWSALWVFISFQEMLQLILVVLGCYLTYCIIAYVELRRAGVTLHEWFRERKQRKTVPTDTAACQDAVSPSDAALEVALKGGGACLLFLVVWIIYLQLNWFETLLVVLLIVTATGSASLATYTTLRSRMARRATSASKTSPPNRSREEEVAGHSTTEEKQE